MRKSNQSVASAMTVLWYRLLISTLLCVIGVQTCHISHSYILLLLSLFPYIAVVSTFDFNSLMSNRCSDVSYITHTYILLLLSLFPSLNYVRT